MGHLSTPSWHRLEVVGRSFFCPPRMRRRKRALVRSEHKRGRAEGVSTSSVNVHLHFARGLQDRVKAENWPADLTTNVAVGRTDSQRAAVAYIRGNPEFSQHAQRQR